MTAPRGLFPAAFSEGDYIGDNFEELKRYLTVLHQNGRSIYNVDQNEKQSINDTWKRRLMQNVMGDGAVEDAFAVVGTGANNDFQIVGGDNAPGTPKNAFVGGFMAIADADTTYLLHNTQYNEDLGTVPVALTTPSGGNRTDKVYLEVFLKEITFADDAFLVPDNLKVALTTRLRLIQEVKVAEGGSVPASPFTDGGGVEHFLFPLATIERFDGQDAINAFDVSDDRRTTTFGILANGGLNLVDPGGMQSAIDNTSGGLPSAGRHVILGSDAKQLQLDNTTAGNQLLAGLAAMQAALDNVVGTPSAGNPVVLQSDIPVPDADGISYDPVPSGMVATDVQAAIEENNGLILQVLPFNSLVIAQAGGSLGVTTVQAEYKVAERLGSRVLDSGGILNLNLTTTGVNGLDTGTLAANTMYHVYAIGSSTGAGPDALIATTSDVQGDNQNIVLEGNLPAGFDLYKWIFHFVTKSALAEVFESHINGRKFNYVINTTRNSLTTTGTVASTLASYVVSALVPPTHTRFVKVAYFSLGNQGLFYAAPPGATGDPTAADIGSRFDTASNQYNPTGAFEWPVNSAGQITLSGQVQSANSSRGFVVMGCEYFH